LVKHKKLLFSLLKVKKKIKKVKIDFYKESKNKEKSRRRLKRGKKEENF